MSNHVLTDDLFSAALPFDVHRQAADHLLAFHRMGRRQENLCFALWRPSRGAKRPTALVYKVLFPRPGELILRGNVSFTAAYLQRACAEAKGDGAGVALMHNHFGPGWQDVSQDDAMAERTRPKTSVLRRGRRLAEGRHFRRMSIPPACLGRLIPLPVVSVSCPVFLPSRRAGIGGLRESGHPHPDIRPAG